MSPVSRKFKRTGSLRFRRRRFRRRNGPLRQIVKKQVRRNRTRSMFRMVRKVDDRIGFQFARYISSTNGLSITIVPATNPQYQGFSISLADVNAESAQFQKWTQLYQFYKLRKVVVIVRPLFTDVELAGLTNVGEQAPYVRVMSRINYNGFLPPSAGAIDYLQWPNTAMYKETYGTQRHVRVFRPRPVDTVKQASNPALAPLAQTLMKRTPWISTLDITPQHYGLMFAYYVENNAFPAAGTIQYRVTVKSYWMFKHYLQTPFP